jgi:hypothetical protein
MHDARQSTLWTLFPGPTGPHYDLEQLPKESLLSRTFDLHLASGITLDLDHRTCPYVPVSTLPPFANYSSFRLLGVPSRFLDLGVEWTVVSVEQLQYATDFLRVQNVPWQFGARRSWLLSSCTCTVVFPTTSDFVEVSTCYVLWFQTFVFFVTTLPLVLSLFLLHASYLLYICFLAVSFFAMLFLGYTCSSLWTCFLLAPALNCGHVFYDIPILCWILSLSCMYFPSLFVIIDQVSGNENRVLGNVREWLIANSKMNSTTSVFPYLLVPIYFNAQIYKSAF